MAAGNVVFMKNGSNYFVSNTGDGEGEVLPNFQLFPFFNIGVQPELINNNFNDEKEWLVSSKKCNRQQFYNKRLPVAYNRAAVINSVQLKPIFELQSK